MAYTMAGKVALITGGSSGIGRSVGLLFAREGARVVVAARRTDAGEETVQMIREAGGEAHFVQTDVSHAAEVHALVNTCVTRYGRPNYAVNNAGIETRGSFLELLEDEWDRVLDVNLKGPYLCGQTVARHMVEHDIHGSIVNIASINSEVALKNQAHYVASKGGLRLLTKAMAIDLAPHGIRVNAVGPGVIDTAMSARSLSDPATREQMLANIPLNRVGQPRDVANVTLFLASEEASYMTGSIVFVDGGWLIH